jgi:hypothetical protein
VFYCKKLHTGDEDIQKEFLGFSSKVNNIEEITDTIIDLFYYIDDDSFDKYLKKCLESIKNLLIQYKY